MEKFKGESEENISGLEFDSSEGMVTWRRVRADGTTSAWEQSTVETGDQKAFLKLKSKLEEKYLREESIN